MGIVPDDVRPADIDETPLPGEVPRAYCRRVTREKAEAVPRSEGEIVLTADTTVSVGRRIFGKPENRDEAGHSGGLAPMEIDGKPCVAVLTLRNLGKPVT